MASYQVAPSSPRPGRPHLCLPPFSSCSLEPDQWNRAATPSRGWDWCGQRVVGHPKAPQYPPTTPPPSVLELVRRGLGVGCFFVVPFRLGLVGAGGEDADGPFPPPDLVAESLPGPVAHHHRRVGSLGEDEQL